MGNSGQFWLRGVGAWLAGPDAHRWTGWLDTDLAGAERVLDGWSTFTQLGQVKIRIVSRLGPLVVVAPSDGHEPVPVLGQDEVERSHPSHARPLARVRERRAGGLHRLPTGS